MKKKELELFLEQVPSYTHPKPKYEQYKTPASIAADMLFTIYGFHDIASKTVLDLGCGTGIFASGASLLHAQRVIGVDIDRDCINQANTFATDHQLPIEYHVTDITSFSTPVDTVVMNPPFGAQKQNIHADRTFIKQAVMLGSVVYSLHLEHTLEFIGKLLASLQKTGQVLNTYQFPLPAQYSFHTKLTDSVRVSFLQIK